MEPKLKKDLLPAEQAPWSRRNYDRRVINHEKAVKAEENVIRWLFALNTAALGGALSYGAVRGLNDYMVASLCASVAGIFSLLVRAAWEHYSVQDKVYDQCTTGGEEFDASAMRAKELTECDLKTTEGSHFLHGLAALSGVLFAIALWAGLQAMKSIAVGDPPARW
jgi:hypothetical protein